MRNAKPSSSAPSSFFLLAALRQWAGRLRATRRQAHQRLALSHMSDAELKDLGIGRSEVQEWLRRRVPETRSGATSTAAAPSNALHTAHA